MDIAAKVAIGEKAEGARDLDGVFEPPGRNVGLPDHRDAGPWATCESAFHGRQSHRLMIANHLGLLVARRERNEERGNQSAYRSSAEVQSCLLQMNSAQSVKRSHG